MMLKETKITTNEKTQALNEALSKARDCFWSYCHLIYPPVDSQFVFSDCHELIIDKLQNALFGNGSKRQAISLPPQIGKSTIVSILFPSWLMGKVPDISIAITGFSHELTTDFSRAIKEIIERPIYQAIFPNVRIDDKLDREDYWQTSNGSILRAKSTGKKLTGRRVDVLIIDDAHAGRDESESRRQRERVVQWYFSDCISRLSPNAAVFMVGTRFHPEDLELIRK